MRAYDKRPSHRWENAVLAIMVALVLFIVASF
jgi:hypothetical protein